MLLDRPRVPLKQILLLGLLPSFLKIWIYRLHGARIGHDVRIGFGSVVVADRMEIGSGTSISFGTFIRGREVKIGRYVHIGALCAIDVEKLHIDDDARVTEQVYVGGPSLPESYLKLGKRTIVMQMSWINPTKPIIVGDDTGIGGHCLLFTHGVWQSKLDGYPVTFAPITLGSNVWLPWRVFIMPGVTVGDNSTVGANSLITKDLPAGCLAAGAPAKVLRTADHYPGSVSTEEKDEMVRSILGEFLRFVSYHGIDVRKVIDEPHMEVEVTQTRTRWWRRSHRTFRLIYNPGGERELPHLPADASTCYLSLTPIPDALRHQLTTQGAVWIDLGHKCRNSNSNDVAEEVAVFLRRYGLRFDRVE